MEQNVIQISGGIMVNVDATVKNIIYVKKKQHVWSPSKCIFENRKYLASIMDDSTIICDEVTNSYEEEIKTIHTNFNEKIVTFKTQFFIALLAFLLIAILLMIAANIYCYMIKYQTKHLLPFHSINN